MKLLALDTTRGACSVAIYLREEENAPEIHHEHRLMERGHAEQLMPMIDDVRKKSGIKLAELDRIAVTVGPGTFTGVRIGIAAARGLALATGAGMVAETSLRVIACQARKKLEPEFVARELIVALDARRGEIYLQIFGAALEPLTDAAAMPPHMAIEHIAEIAPEGVLVGNATGILVEAGLSSGQCPLSELSDIEPDARDLAELAAIAEETADHVSPLYLRAPDAKPQTGKSIARIDGAAG